MNLFALPATPASASSFASSGASNATGGLFDSEAAAPSGPSFGQMLEGALGQVNSLQDHSAQMTQAFARGKISDVHSVMIASEQATVALQLTTQIRNKAVDAYQEIMRISM
jgi:flagellar hook-basal body complex protein FliE